MNRMFAMLLVLMILLTGCVSDNKKENGTVPDVSVSNQENVDSGAGIDTSATADIDSGEAED